MRVLAALLLCLVPFASLAQNAKSKDLTLPVARIIALANAIGSLDTGVDRVIKEGNTERIFKEPYKFDAPFRIAMARNYSALQPIISGYDKARNAALLSIGQGSPIKPESPEGIRFALEERKLQEIEQKVSLYVAPQEMLKLDVNSLPFVIVSALEPVIDFGQ